MPNALPIAGVSAGLLTRFGNAAVTNATRSFTPQGFDSAKVSSSHAVYFSGQIGAVVWFPFEKPYSYVPSSLNVHFTFGGDPLITGVGNFIATQFGVLTATKAAKDFAPTGWDSSVFSNNIRVWNYVENAGAAVNFPFIAAYSTPTSYNTPFYFGGNPVVGGATAGTCTQFGLIQKVEKPLQISPVGFKTRITNFGILRVGDRGPVDFLFTATYTVPTALNTPFYFNGILPVVAGNNYFTQIGLPTIVNSAKTIAPVGWDTLTFARPILSFKGQTGVGVNFSFVASYLVPNTLNVPFYFAGILNPNPISWDSFASGTPWISLKVRTLQVPGSTYAAFGTTKIENWAEFAAAPSGINSLTMGIPNIEKQLLLIEQASAGEQTLWGTLRIAIIPRQYLTTTGLLASQWGVPRVEHFIRRVYPTGYSATQYGTAVFTHYTRYLYQLSASPLTQWGTTKVLVRRYLLPLGPDVLVIPNTHFIDWLNVPRPTGWNSATFGTTWISFYRRTVAHYNTKNFFESGTPTVYNSRQYIFCTEDTTWWHPTKRGFGQYIYIENVNKVLVPGGWLSTRFGTATDIYNNAWVIYATSVPPTAVPHIDRISNWLRTVAPYGFPTLVFDGLPFVSLYLRYLTAFGSRFDTFGYAQLLQGEPPIATKGWSQTRFGQPTVIEWLKRVVQINSNARFGAFGTPDIFNNTPRYLNLNGHGILGFGSGSADVGYYIRNIRQYNPHLGNFFGYPAVDHKNRRVYPVWFVPTQYGVATVSREIELFPVGWPILKIGTPTVQLGNVLFTIGWQSSKFPDVVWVSRSPRNIYCQNQLVGLEWGKPKLRNVRQYLIQYEDPDWFKPYNRGFGQNALVYNVNRKVYPQGLASQRFSVDHTVLNTGRAILPLSIPPTSDPKIFEISLYVRYVYPQGRDSLWVSWYNAIYNDAYALYPVGIPSSLVIPKVPLVFSNLQTIKHHTGSDTQWGDHLVAFRIRYINMMFGKDYMRFGLANRVSLWEQYFPVGESKDFGRVGTPAVLGPFKKEIKPRWLKLEDAFGYAYVKNKIPQAFVQGFESLDTWYSRHRISFYRQPALVTGLGPDTQFGRLSIKDRRQWVYMIGSETLSIPIIHRVKNVLPDPPQNQIVYPVGFSLYEIPLKTGVGTPIIQGMPYPEGWDSSKFGTTWIRVQGCITEWEWPDSQWTFGIPFIAAPLYITQKNNDLDNGLTQWGKPRLSPHTIWCRLDTPQQAITNHPGRSFYELDADRGFQNSGAPGNQYAGPWFGLAYANDGRPRYLNQYHYYSQAAGGVVSTEAHISNWVRYIRPPGWDSKKFGYPEFPTIKRIWGIPLVSLLMGEPTVGFPPGWVWTQYVTASAGVLTRYGTLRIEFKNRSVRPNGYVATQFGNNTPMVHFRRVLYPEGVDATQFGTQLLSYRIRSVYMEGFDSFLCEESVEFMSDVMKVYWKTFPVNCTSIQMTEFGKPTLYLTTQYIRPYQIQGTRCRPGRGAVVSRGN